MPGTERLFTDYQARHRAGATPAEIIAEVYARIAAHNDPALFIHLLPQAQALAYADALAGKDPASLPLFGIPFAIKDNIDLAGVPTTAACPAFAYTPNTSAPAVESAVARADQCNKLIDVVNRNTAKLSTAVENLADVATDRVLGAHIIGKNASEMIEALTVLLEFSGSAEDLARTTAPHPTLSEAIREAALMCGDGAIHI